MTHGFRRKKFQTTFMSSFHTPNFVLRFIFSTKDFIVQIVASNEKNGTITLIHDYSNFKLSDESILITLPDTPQS